MKTIGEWIETLDEPYKSKALKNTNVEMKSVMVGMLVIAIVRAFDWSKSKEGYKYWNKLFNTIHEK